MAKIENGPKILTVAALLHRESNIDLGGFYHSGLTPVNPPSKVNEVSHPLVLINTVVFNALQDLLDENNLRENFKARFLASRNCMVPVPAETIFVEELELDITCDIKESYADSNCNSESDGTPPIR